MGDERYSRQMLFTPIGKAGQEEIGRKHAIIVGVGALGTNTAEMLARAGIGKLTLIDRDYVEWSNLQRQHLFTEEDAEKKWPKAEAAKRKLKAINSEAGIEAIAGHADAGMLESLAPGADLILDGTDNFETRFLLNDIAQKHRIPYLFGSCVGSFGMTFTIVPGKTPCLNCLLKNLPLQGETCDTAGIISPAVGMVTAYQGAEALKILSGNPEAIRTTYLSFDLWENETIALKADMMKNPDCPSCGENPVYPYLEKDAETKVAVLCGRNTVQIRPADGSLSLPGLAERWKAAGYEVGGNPFLVSVKKADIRAVFFKDGRALIHGTSDPSEARKLYHSLVG